jgi:hypothetical protein
VTKEWPAKSNPDDATHSRKCTGRYLQLIRFIVISFQQYRIVSLVK